MHNLRYTTKLSLAGTNMRMLRTLRRISMLLLTGGKLQTDKLAMMPLKLRPWLWKYMPRSRLNHSHHTRTQCRGSSHADPDMLMFRARVANDR